VENQVSVHRLMPARAPVYAFRRRLGIVSLQPAARTGAATARLEWPIVWDLLAGRAPRQVSNPEVLKRPHSRQPKA
jgi:hypothetical protein